MKSTKILLLFVLVLVFLTLWIHAQEADEDSQFWSSVEQTEEKPASEKETTTPSTTKEEPSIRIISNEKVKNATETPKIFNLPQQEHFYFELFGIVVIVFMCFIYVQGRNKNDQIALKFVNLFQTTLTSNFTNPGLSNNRTTILKDGNSDFKLYATGRRNCYGALFKLELAKRFDLMSMAMGLAFSSLNPKDKLIIEVFMKEDAMQPFVFAVVSQKEQKSYQKDCADLNTFGAVYSLEDIFAKHAVITDAPELAKTNGLLTSNVLNTLNKWSKYFIRLHVTDHALFSQSQYSHAFRLELELPPIDKLHEINDLIQMSMELIDLIAQSELNSKTLQVNEKLRADLKAKAQKRAEEEKKKSEEVKQEEKPKEKSLTERKREEREKRKREKEKEKQEEKEKKNTKPTIPPKKILF